MFMIYMIMKIITFERPTIFRYSDMKFHIGLKSGYGPIQYNKMFDENVQKNMNYFDFKETERPNESMC